MYYCRLLFNYYSVYLLNVMLKQPRIISVRERNFMRHNECKTHCKKANSTKLLHYRTSSKLCKFILAQKPTPSFASLLESSLMIKQNYYVNVFQMEIIEL